MVKLIVFAVLILGVIVSSTLIEESAEEPSNVELESSTEPEQDKELEIPPEIDLNNNTDSPEPAVEYTNTTTLQNETVPVTKNGTKHNLAKCLPLNSTQTIEIVNATRLLKLITTDPNITSKEDLANCVSVLFYSQSCPYSCRLAKAYNALPKAFPNVKMVAIEAMTHHLFNAQNGIVGVPTMVLYHNGRILGKLSPNDYQVELIIRFMMTHVDGGAKDFEEARRNCYVHGPGMPLSWKVLPPGPLPVVPVYQRDYCLGLSWLFIIVCGLYFFSKSKCYSWIVETIQNTWRESEAQALHEHAE